MHETSVKSAGICHPDNIEPPCGPLPPARPVRFNFPFEDRVALFHYYEHGVRRLEAPSTMDAQLQRLQFFADSMKPCEACGGDRKKWTGGTGFASSSKEAQLQEWLATLDLADRNLIPGCLDPCPVCTPSPEDLAKGVVYAPGWVPGRRRARGPITARPTGSSKQGNGVPETGGNDNLALLGYVTRGIAAVRAVDPIAEKVLEAYCSPDGRCIGSLWHLVPAGKTMLKNKPPTLSARQWFENERERQRRSPSVNRAQQFQAADKQSEALLQHTILVWLEAVGTNRRTQRRDAAE